MATKPKIPPPSVPVIDPRTGLMNAEWYRAFAQFTQAGEFATTVGAAGGAAALPATPKGYATIFVSIGGESVPKQFPFYDPA